MLTNKYKKAESYYFKGITLNDQGNWGLAEEEFLRALVLFTKLEHWEKAVCCHCSLGNVCFNKGNISETLKHWLSALALYEEKLKQKTEAGELCLDIGDLYYDMKNMYGAGQYYSRAFTLFQEEPLDNEINMGTVNHKLGNVCFSQERFPQAEKHYLISQPIYEKYSKEEGLADIFKALGHIYMVQNEFAISKKYFMKSFDISSKLELEEQKNEVANLLLTIDNRLEQKRLEKKQRDLEKKLRELERASPKKPMYSARQDNPAYQASPGAPPILQSNSSSDSLSYSSSTDQSESEAELSYSARQLQLSSRGGLSPSVPQRPNTEPSKLENMPCIPAKAPAPRNSLQAIFSNITNQQSYKSIVKKRQEPDVLTRYVAPLKQTTPKNPKRRL